MSVILETDRDRMLEDRSINRMISELSIDAQAIRLPRLAACDYVLMYGEEIRFGIEVKTRKETPATIRGYGGLMLKHRKLVELQDLSRMLSMRMFVLFAFEDGMGAMLSCEPSRITDVEPVTPPVRRNFRGLACDEEPVVFLDWDRHLSTVL